MLYEIAKALDVPVSRFFEGLPGNPPANGEARPLPVDERLNFIASAEGRRLIEGVMTLPRRVRGRVSALIAALGEELIDGKSDMTGRNTLMNPMSMR
ncbi:hypothetical protein [Mesorhizobium loti]|uniref:hypothetical protein n=1 Tax=Rhizobium loti TaxID=381 RepID=UPI0003FA4440|nr:hypothetical protein [Mesorhizobium loti]